VFLRCDSDAATLRRERDRKAIGGRGSDELSSSRLPADATARPFVEQQACDPEGLRYEDRLFWKRRAETKRQDTRSWPASDGRFEVWLAAQTVQPGSQACAHTGT